MSPEGASGHASASTALALTEPALVVSNTDGVEIDGLAITGAETGIEVIGSLPCFGAHSDWLGVKLDGSAGGNGTGMLPRPRIEPGSRSATRALNRPTSSPTTRAVGLDHLRRQQRQDLRQLLRRRTGRRHAGALTARTSRSPRKSANSTANGNAIGTKVSTESASETPELRRRLQRDLRLRRRAASIWKVRAAKKRSRGEHGDPSATTSGSTRAGACRSRTPAAGVAIGTGGPHQSSADPGPAKPTASAVAQPAVRAGPAAPNLVDPRQLDRYRRYRRRESGGARTKASSSTPKGSRTPPLEALIADNEIAHERRGRDRPAGPRGMDLRQRDSRRRDRDRHHRLQRRTRQPDRRQLDRRVHGRTGSCSRTNSTKFVGNEVLGSGRRRDLVRRVPLFPASMRKPDRRRHGGERKPDLRQRRRPRSRSPTSRTQPDRSGPQPRGRQRRPLHRLWSRSNRAERTEGPNEGIKPPTFFERRRVRSRGLRRRTRVPASASSARPSAAPGELESFLGEAIADEEGEWSVALPPVRSQAGRSSPRRRRARAAAPRSWRSRDDPRRPGAVNCALNDGRSPAAPHCRRPDQDRQGPEGKKSARDHRDASSSAPTRPARPSSASSTARSSRAASRRRTTRT